MALPGINAVSIIKVQVTDPLTGIPVLTDVATITAPTDKEVIKVAWYETLYSKNITFSWSAISGAEKYEIEISEDHIFPMMSTLLIESEDNSYKLPAYYLPLDKTLYLRVRGVADDGFTASPWSEVISFSVTKELLAEGLERLKLTTGSGTETQYVQSVRDEEGKKHLTIKGLMKLKVQTDEDGTPLTYTDFLKDGDIWYDKTG